MVTQRTCFVCRKKAEKSQLLRFITTEGPQGDVLRADPEQRGDGRGVYAHPTAACLLSKRFMEALRGARRKVRRDAREAGGSPLPIELFAREQKGTRGDSGEAILRSLEDVLEVSDGDSKWMLREGKRAKIWKDFRECVFRLRSSIEQAREPKGKRTIRL